MRVCVYVCACMEGECVCMCEGVCITRVCSNIIAFGTLKLTCLRIIICHSVIKL